MQPAAANASTSSFNVSILHTAGLNATAGAGTGGNGSCTYPLRVAGRHGTQPALAVAGAVVQLIVQLRDAYGNDALSEEDDRRRCAATGRPAALPPRAAGVAHSEPAELAQRWPWPG